MLKMKKKFEVIFNGGDKRVLHNHLFAIQQWWGLMETCGYASMETAS